MPSSASNRGRGQATPKENTRCSHLMENQFGFMQILEGDICGCTGGGAVLALPACCFLDVFPGDHTQSPP